MTAAMNTQARYEEPNLVTTCSCQMISIFHSTPERQLAAPCATCGLFLLDTDVTFTFKMLVQQKRHAYNLNKTLCRGDIHIFVCGLLEL